MRRVLVTTVLAIGVVSSVVATWVIVGGSINLTRFHVPLRVHDPWRPAIVAIAALVVFVVAKGRWEDVRGWSTIADRFDDRLAAALLAAAVCVAGIAYATTAASGSDAYGYVSQADAWLSGQLKIPQLWAQQAPWPSSRWSFSPLGWRPGDADGPDAWSLVPSYSPGLPLIMAGAKLVGGQEGMFWVVPIAGGLLVLATFGLGRRLGDSRAGLVAAWLVATSPVVLFMLMAPMTDVPVAAAWTIACYFAFGDSAGAALAAGAAAAVAILIRPNLVFEAGPLGLWFLVRGWRSGRWRRAIGHAATFGASASCGIAAVAIINQRLYGSPFVSGYGGFSGWFTRANIATNAQHYLGWLIYAQTPVALAGLAALVVPLKRLWPGVKDRAIFAIIGLYLSALALQYFAFLVFDAWWYLRFLIAGLPFVLLGVGAIATAFARARKPVLTLAAAIAVAALGVRDFRVAAAESSFHLWEGERRYVSMAKLVRTSTEPTSVIYSMQHSGSLRYYAGRLTLNYANLDGEWLDRSVAWIVERGSHPYLVLESWEIELFRKQFAGQKTLAILDTAPILMYEGGAQISLYDLTAPTDRSASTLNITEMFIDRQRSVRPVPPATVVLGR